MYFSSQEIFESVISALVLGSIFAVICIFVGTVYDFLFSLFSSRRGIFRYAKIFEKPTIISVGEKEKVGALGQLITFFKVVTFGLLYILLSYYSLDGEMRIYLLLLFAASYFFLYITLHKLLRPRFLWLLQSVSIMLIYVIRVFLVPLRLIWKILSQFVKKTVKMASKLKHKSFITLDKLKK